jgi:hypothetical protein
VKVLVKGFHGIDKTVLNDTDVLREINKRMGERIFIRAGSRNVQF